MAKYFEDLNVLEDHLCQLAANWRESKDPILVTEYTAVMEHMFQLGWDGHLDLVCELPYALMPAVYTSEVSQLENRLYGLAAAYRAKLGDEDARIPIIKEYHQVMDKLFDLGWDGIMDIEQHLPRDRMPKSYTDRHPYHPPKFGTLRAPKK